MRWYKEALLQIEIRGIALAEKDHKGRRVVRGTHVSNLKIPKNWLSWIVFPRLVWTFESARIP